MIKVSVIIPVYGVEKYIVRCARSLFEQTLDDIEYLFVDDCSPDHSVDILQSVLKDYPNRKNQVVIHKMDKNSGQAAVRKWGMEHATGQFVIHCDSDDWVDTNAYKSCYDEAVKSNSDIVFFDFEVTDGVISKCKKRNIPNEKLDIIRNLVSGKLMGSLWGMLVKRSLYDNIIYYPKDNLNEDLVLSIQLINTAKGFSYIRKPFYHYQKSIQSITAKGSLEKTLANFYQSYNNTELILKYLLDIGVNNSLQYEILTRKLINIKTLYPYSDQKKVRLICNHCYEISLRDVIRNKLNTFNVKWFYFLYILGIVSYVYKLKKLMCNKIINQ